MADEQQRWYFHERAETSLRLATEATLPTVAAVHDDFHEGYMRRAGQDPAPRPTLWMVR